MLEPILQRIRANFSKLTTWTEKTEEPVEVWFSYETPVGVRYRPNGAKYDVMVVRRNEWGPTTGRHLNALDGGQPHARKQRVSAGVLHKVMEMALAGKPMSLEAIEKLHL